MSKIDLIVTLVVRIALVIGGASLAFNGGTGLTADLMMYRVYGDSQPDMVLSFVGGHFAMFAGGVAIVIAAAIGIVRAVRKAQIAEPEPTDDAPAQPLSVLRVLSALGFGAGALFGLVTLAPAIVPIADIFLLAVAGESAVATVQPLENEEDHILTYTFRVDGTRYTGSSEIGPNLWPTVKRYRTIDVRYLRWNPNHSEVNVSDDVSSGGYFLATRLGLILVGIWGVWKNLRRTPGGPRPEAQPVTPRFETGLPVSAPAAPRPIPPRPGARRTSFGRRGA